MGQLSFIEPAPLRSALKLRSAATILQECRPVSQPSSSYPSDHPTPTQSTQSPQPTQPTIDYETLNELRELTDNDPKEFASLVNNYLSSTGRLMDRVGKAVPLGDAKTIQIATHDIKSMSAMFGAMHLADLARTMETKGAEGDLSGMESLWAATQAAFAQVQAIMLVEISG